MFDISFSELALIGVIALLVLGPQRMPQALRTLGLWVGRASRAFRTMRAEIEREIGMDEVRRQLHNEAIMDQLKRLESDVKGEAQANGATTVQASNAAPGTQDHSPKPEPAANGETTNVLPPR